MKRTTLAGSMAACICLGFAAPLLAAEPATTGTGPAVTGTASQSSPTDKTVSSSKPAETCLGDLRAFDTQMEKEGYWLGGSGYAYGYPLGGYGYDGYWGDSGFGHGYGGHSTASYWGHARPGYDVRALIVAANILAQRGQQQPCEDLLAETRDIYKLYMADMRSGGMPMADMPGWRKQQIAAAVPVTSKNTSFRSGELVGAAVRSPQNEALGSVEDLVMSPQTGKIAYLVIARGGIFGIGEKYVPVPWEDFKVAPNANMLVLDSNKGAMDKAPQVNKDQFATLGRQNEKVDGYWKTSFLNKGN